jgi:hypothetical protein
VPSDHSRDITGQALVVDDNVTQALLRVRL